MNVKRNGEPLLRGIINRLLQEIARKAPGARSWRVWLNRWRGVHIGKGVWIGYDALIETSSPYLVTIKDGASLGIRCTVVAHMRERRGVTIEEDADIGTGAIIVSNDRARCRGCRGERGDKIRAAPNDGSRQSRHARSHGRHTSQGGSDRERLGQAFEADQEMTPHFCRPFGRVVRPLGPGALPRFAQFFGVSNRTRHIART